VNSALSTSILAVPVVVVFTQYDRLVRKDKGLNKEDSRSAAQRDFDGYAEIIKDAAKRLKIGMPSLINVSSMSKYAIKTKTLIAPKFVKDTTILFSNLST
jgi:hypothetical protein